MTTEDVAAEQRCSGRGTVRRTRTNLETLAAARNESGFIVFSQRTGQTSPVSQTLGGDLPASALDGRDSQVSQSLQLVQRNGSTSAAAPGIIIVDFVTNDFLVLIVFPVLLSSTLLRTTLSCSLRRYAATEVGTAPWIRTSAVRGTIGRRRQQR